MNKSKLEALGHDMSNKCVCPELPGKDLAVVAQTDDTVTLQDMDNPERYLTADNMVVL